MTLETMFKVKEMSYYAVFNVSTDIDPRTSDSLNERLSIKMARNFFQRKQ